MAERPLPTTNELRQLLDYDPETGVLTWRQRHPSMFKAGFRTAEHTATLWNGRYAGKPAGKVGNHGYLECSVHKRFILAHRIIWAICHGEWPTEDIDHINHVRTDNRLGNLRSVSRKINMRNLKKRKHNTSGVTGVYWNAAQCKWQAQIRKGGRNCGLGAFDNIEDAAKARRAAEREMGYHEAHGT